LHLDFFPSGSDERQYCSPGYNLPVGTISRTFPGRYDVYHTSLDNKAFVSFEVMADTVRAICEVVDTLEGNRVYKRVLPYGEPHLGSRGLMSTVGAARDSRARYEAIKWFLNLADGTYDLIAMAERSGVDVHALLEAAQRCVAAGLVAVDRESGPAVSQSR
jgi:aminopeptidase-like protein